nr:MAG TPA: hypothetical protein [Microviridae sp.]
MCLNPITIQSNARYFVPFVSSAENIVPCGRCDNYVFKSNYHSK